jgi:probable RNA-binding protein EIF1AD
MAGVGRRTHYRKHLTDSVLNDLPVPTETERIAKVVATRGGNHFEILLASTSAQEDDPSVERKSVLAMMPRKFRKLVWLRRNDFIIVDTGDAGDTEDSTDAEAVAAAAAVTGIRYIISHILYKDQVKNLQVKSLWPVNDSEFGDIDGIAEQGMRDDEEDTDANHTADDGIVYDRGMQEDDYLTVNTNRTGPALMPDSSDSEDDN